jgi:hypothetical protein
MSHRIFAVSLILTMSYWIQANENFIPGMVVTSMGDTLTGMIDYQNWDQSPESIRFCRKLDDKVVIYKPFDVKLFQVDGDIYIGTEADVETSTRQVKLISSEPAMQLTRKSVFLRTLVTGTKSLYHYKDSNTEDLFYIKVDSTYKLLGYKLYLNDENDVNSVRELKKYVGQLIYYMRDQPELKKTIQSVQYTRYNLTSVFIAYNKLVQPTISNQIKKEKFKINYGISTAATINSIHFTGTGFPELVLVAYSPGLSFTPGLFVEFVEPRNLGRWSIYSELLYVSYKFDSQYDEGNSIFKTNLDFGYLKLYNLLRYRILLPNGALFVNGGFSMGSIIHEINDQQRISKINSSWNVTGRALEDIYRHELGLVFGAGIIYKHFTLETRYAFGSGMSPYLLLGSQTRSSSIVASYNF